MTVEEYVVAMKYAPAPVFKARCLALMKKVQATGERRGRHQMPNPCCRRLCALAHPPYLLYRP
jgi:hypothetical protein